ncbi:MAG: hypothetical protein JNM66_27550 [Bryobacterales bacterium]|nr:hypothetical protein [Bryobacterales bacterium]
MRGQRAVSLLSLLISIGLWVLPAATLGTVINITGGASDLVLDNNRNLLYLVRAVPYNRIDVFSTTQRRVIASVPTDANPLAAALSTDGNFLYITCHEAASINIMDTRPATPVIVSKVSLPARPEGIAVGGDGRVLITTIGSGAGNLLNTMLVYDPAVTEMGASLSTVPVAPPPPLPPTLPAPSGRTFLANRSQLIATRDGSKIIGLNAYQAQNRVVFVYETASRSVLRSRIVGDLSTVLSVAPDGSRFMVGLRLFDTESLAVIAQQNAANAPFPLSSNITAQGFAQVGQQFNLQQNQGGSVFSPDGATIYSAFNIAPIQQPAARANVTQLLINDADNLLIQDGLQLPENLAGKMVMSLDGSSLYALSESGFTIIPLNEVSRNPLLQPSASVLLLASDQCNSAPEGTRTRVDLVNQGRSQTPVTATATLVQSLGGVAIPGLGVGGGVVVGPGGGQPGGGVVIIAPTLPIPGVGTIPGLNNAQQVTQQTAPSLRVVRDGPNTAFEIAYNFVNSRSLGTPAAHDYLITSPQAVNLPATIRVFQNSRNTESRGDLIPVRTAISPNEGLTDILADATRNRLYISNSGLNRVEVFDTRSKRFLAPIKVGQLPRSLAMSPDSSTLYVANTGGESISIIDLDRMQVSGKIRFPAIPFNGATPVISPSSLAVTQSGLQIVMSNGTLWRVVGDEAVPRRVSAVIGAATVPAPRTIAATPNGEYMILLAGNGNAYLYDSLVDDFVAARQVATAPIQGFFGPVSAGPRGQYFLVNDIVLNQSLSPIAGSGGTGAGGAPVVPGRPGPTATNTRPVAAVFAATGGVYAKFSQPIRANANAVVTDVPTIELVNAATGATTRTIAALEGPTSTVTGTARVNIDGRTMAVDAALENAYVLTASGLGIVPLTAAAATDRPQVPAAGVVNVGNFTASAAPNGLVSIFGQNLGASESAGTSPLPLTLGGTCVTVNNSPIPLLMTSPGQINAQVPPELAAGRYTMLVRSIDRKISSQAVQFTVAKYAPAVLANATTKRALIFRPNGEPVTTERPAKRDEPLVMYAVGLGNPKGTTRLVSGTPAPADRLLETDALEVYFKKVETAEDKTRGFRAQEEVIVDWSGLVPGYVGLYQINFRVPGFHEKGPNLEVVVRIGGINSSITGPVVPLVAVE